MTKCVVSSVRLIKAVFAVEFAFKVLEVLGKVTDVRSWDGRESKISQSPGGLTFLSSSAKFRVPSVCIDNSVRPNASMS